MPKEAEFRRPTLDDIVAVTHRRIAALQENAAILEMRLASAPAARPFPGALGDTVGLIAEVKRRSPSHGAIHLGLDPVAHAHAYVKGGALAVSVLTDEPHFGGSLEDLKQVAAAVRVPVLRKDFILDGLQLVEARAAGASAVLLIARILSAEQLSRLAEQARSLDLATLIEVHAEKELDAALAAQPDALGVNARDLDTFAVDLEAAEAVIARVPARTPVVAESGIETRRDVERLAARGADLVLVGTSLARHADPESAARALTHVKRIGRD